MPKETIVIAGPGLDDAVEALATGLPGVDVTLAVTEDELQDAFRKKVSTIVSEAGSTYTRRLYQLGMLTPSVRRGSRPPVILVADNGSSDEEDSWLRLGAFDLAIRPLVPEAFCSVVDRARASRGRLQQRILSWIHHALPVVLVLCAVLCLWEFACFFFEVPTYIVPSPHEIVVATWSELGSLVRHTSITAMEAVLGFSLANVIGFLIAAAFVHSSLFQRSCYPYIVASQSLPLIVLAPLLILWLGNGLLSKVVMAAIICFFPAVVFLTTGLKSVGQAELDLFHSLSASRWQIFWKLRFPNALPYLFAALKVSATLSIVGAIVAELAGSDCGIGYVILTASYRLDTLKLFSAILMCSIFALAIFIAVLACERMCLFWHESRLTK